MPKEYDIAIVGGGLVGCLISLILAKKGNSICLLEKNAFKQVITDKYIPLSLTINSINFLKKNKIWNEKIFKSNQISELTIKLFNSFNTVHFSTNDLTDEHFMGSIIDKTSFLSHLRNLCVQNKDIEIFDDIEVSIENTSSPFKLSSSQESSRFICKHLVVTDGANSEVGKKLDFKSIYVNYKQTSYMFNIDHDTALNEAFQIFTNKGIFAILPCGNKSISIVASIYNKYIDYFNFESEDSDIRLLERELSPYVDGIKNPKLVYKYPLKTSRLSSWSKDNIICLGNSSQLLHPFGAQGFNFSVECIKQIDLCDGLLFKDGKLNSQIFSRIESKRNILLKSIDFVSSALMRKNIFPSIPSIIFSKTMNLSSTLRKSFLKSILGLS